MKHFGDNQAWRQRLNFSRFALRYKRLFIAAWLGIAVAGVLAFTSLNYALFPNITFPVVVVTAKAPLDTAIATETQLTTILEKQLQSLEDIDEIYSVTYPGQSVINVLFSGGTSLEQATTGVKGILEATNLTTATDWQVFPLDLNQSPAISYVLLSSKYGISELEEIAREKIFPPLTALSGVRKVNVLGLNQDINQNFPTRISFNGQEALGFQVIKRHDANTLKVVEQVQAKILSLETELSDIQITLAETQADYIKASVNATLKELAIAIILAIIVIFCFLRNWRATLITALGIPLSLLGTCIVMAIAGLTLQTLTLLALALVIGIVIDDSIVDVENIYRLINQGKSPDMAALEGTDEISLAVTASTLTIAAVFIPVAFMGGTAGKFFQPFGVTVAAAVIFSLLVARTLAPNLAVLWLKPHTCDQASSESRLSQRYRGALSWCLRHRSLVMAIALGSIILGVSLIPLIPKGFIPKLDRGEFNVIYTVDLPQIRINPKTETNNQVENRDLAWLGNLRQSPQAFLLRKSLRVGQDLEAVVLSHPDVESVLTIAGIRGQPNKGKLAVQLKSERQQSTAEVQSRVRESLPSLPGVTVSVEDIPFVETEAEKPLQIAILGEDLNLLQTTAQEILAQAQQIPGLVDLELSSVDSDQEQIERLNGQRVIYFSANLDSTGALEDLTEELEAQIEPQLPSGISLRRWGSADHSNQVLRRFGRTLTLSVILMSLVLIGLFRRLLEPIVVILSLPLSVLGAMLGLLISQSDFGIISLIGFIFLVGLLDKNALLLMDYANQLRSQGLSRDQALIETGVVRLRPILMTTFSTVLGMLPIALGWGAGAELRQPMAVAIMGGLLSSSLLSLFVVPVLYTLLEDLGKKAKR